jgi:hypothetical protein
VCQITNYAFYPLQFNGLGKNLPKKFSESRRIWQIEESGGNGYHRQPTEIQIKQKRGKCQIFAFEIPLIPRIFSPMSKKPPRIFLVIAAALVIAGLAAVAFLHPFSSPAGKNDAESIASSKSAGSERTDIWIERARSIDELYHIVYTPCWEGAYGAIGDAYLFAATNDSSLLRFHLVDHDLRAMCEGRWVDDRAWVCLAELAWWRFTGKNNEALVLDARRRYLAARGEGRLSDWEGFWSWYNWPPSQGAGVFTNSNMNQMATAACGLYEATHDRRFLDDALLVWHGSGKIPGIEQMLYKGNGKWEGKAGRAAFGKQLPWEGVEYCPLAAALYRATGEEEYRATAIATARRVMDPANGWIDPSDYYQIRMDGNGAFVNFLLDAYMAAPDSLSDLPGKIETMLTHVWTNHDNTAQVTLHRETDHGIRNGWNPQGGEDGYGVDEVGTVHAQAEAVRAFGVFAYVRARFR